MKTLVRWIVGLLATLLLLSFALSLAVIYLFDPNDYKDDIAALVSEQTGRSFSIEGDLNLQAFPCCGVALGPLTLGNPQGFPDAPFARIERAVVDLQLLPLLLRQELRIGNVELQGLDARLIKRKDGKVNWDFESDKNADSAPASAPKAKGPALTDLAIAGISVSDGGVTYTDESTGEAIALSDITLNTSTIRQGKPFDIDASLAALGVVPDARAELEVNAQLYLDPESSLLDVMQLYSDLRVTGDSLPGGNLNIAIDLDAARGLGGKRASIEGLAARIKTAGVNLQVSGDGALVDNAPQLNGKISVDSFSPQQLLKALGEKPVVTQDGGVLQRAQLQGDWSYAGDKAALENIVSNIDDSKIKGWLRADSLEKEQYSFDIELDAIDLNRYAAPDDASADEAAAGKPEPDSAAADEASLGLPLEQLRKLNLEGRIAVGRLKTGDAELSDMTVVVRARQGQIMLNPVNAKFDGSSYVGDLRLDARGNQPKLAFDFTVDNLDLDRYVKPAAESGGTGQSESASGDETLDLPVDTLRQLYLDGRINVGKFRFSGARLSDVLVTISARNGQIRMNPLTANLYSGSYSGDMRLDVTGEQPKLSVNEKLSGVQIGALLADASKVRNLDGISEARVTATAAGNSVNELLANLAGDASLDIQKGVFKGVDLWYEIRKARALLKREAPPSAPKDPFTDISKLTGTAKFANGSIANNDFQAQASYLGINGKGTVNLLESTLDYRLDAKVVGTPTFDDGKKLGDMNGMVLPVTIKGKLASPSVKVDVGAMAVDVGKRKLLDRLEKKLGVEKPAAPADASSGAPAGSADGSGAAAADAEPDQQAPQQQESKPEDPKEQLKKSLLKMLGN